MQLKKTIGSLLIGAVVLFGADYKEGENYTTLKQPFNVEKGTVVKVWSYDCPFCYKYDKAVTTPVMNKAGVKFETWHLSTKAKYGKQASNLMAVATVIDSKAGKTVLSEDSILKKIKMAYYKNYHDKRQRWDGGEEQFYAQGLKMLGMSKEQFNKEVSSSEVQSLLKRWEPSLEIAKVQGIPGFVVNGKYLISTAKVKSRDYMVDLIKYLESK